MYLDYWTSALEGALEDAGIVMSVEQIKTIAESLVTSHELYPECGVYTPSGQGDQSLRDRVAELERKLKETHEKWRSAIEREYGGSDRVYARLNEYGELRVRLL